MNTNIGDRMKRYEDCYNYKLTPRMPVIIRADGRAFHTFTRGMTKPFDQKLMTAMSDTMARTAKNMQGFKIAYTQSDEISFLITDDDNLDTQGWFNYELNKIVSTVAADTSVIFSSYFKDVEMGPTFDARAFNVPREDVSNYFLWRAKDWARNSLQMYARYFYSQKDLHGKSHSEIHEMLHSVGKNWTTDIKDNERNGTWLLKSPEWNTTSLILPNFVSINTVIEPLIYNKQKDAEKVFNVEAGDE